MSSRTRSELHEAVHPATDARGVSAPPVQAALRSESTALDAGTRRDMQRRFGGVFGDVRVHAGPEAGAAAHAMGALAFTVGNHIVFGEGRFEPRSGAGRALLAHELTHVIQQSAGRGASASQSALEAQAAHNSRSVEGSGQVVVPAGGAPLRVMREAGVGDEPPKKSFYAQLKERAYSGLIDLVRAARKNYIGLLRKAAQQLPQSMQSAAAVLIDIYEQILEVVESLLYAVIGVLVGFGEGIAGMIAGLWGLTRGIIKLSFDLIVSALTGSDAFERDLVAIGNALLGLPGAIKALCTTWLDEFKKASTERQSLMIGELTGQILALIATYALTVSKIGSAGKVGAAGSAEAATSAGGRAAAVAETTVQSGRPTLTLIKGGGQAAPRTPVALAERAAPAVERGQLALARKPVPVVDPVPIVEPVPLAPAPVPVKPLPQLAPVAQPAAQLGTGAKVAVGVGVGVARASRKLPDVLQEETEDETTGCRYRPIAQQFGRYPCHADFATHLSGDRREFRVTTPEGMSVDFDAMDHGGNLYEVKTGYRWIVSKHPDMQDRIRTTRERFVDQSVTQQEVADRCGRPLRWYFNEDVTAEYFRTTQPIEPPVLHEEYDCDPDSDR